MEPTGICGGSLLFGMDCPEPWLHHRGRMRSRHVYPNLPCYLKWSDLRTGHNESSGQILTLYYQN